MKARKKVIIIGGGIAGLAAADKLARHFEVTLLEASNRLGGRVWTDRSWPETLDLGAQVIHGFKKNPIAGLAKKLKLKTTAANYEDYYLYDTEGKQVPDAVVQKNQKLFEKAVHHLPSKKQSLEAALRKVLANSFPKPWLEWFQESQTIYSGSEPRHHAAQYYQQDNEYEGPNCFFPKGYDQILKGFKNLNKVKIILKGEVKKIEWNTKSLLRASSAVNLAQSKTAIRNSAEQGLKICVTTWRGKFSADYGLITLPLGVLKSKQVQFSPALPDWKQKVIERLGMGTLDMIFMRFSKVFWPTDRVFLGILGKRGDFMRYVNRCRLQKSPLLVALMAGEHAAKLEKLSDQKISQLAMKPLRKVFGSQIPNPKQVKITRWASDPFFCGSYSFIAAQASPKAYEILAKPLNQRLFFAGEATNREHPATVHGAYLSGIREADRLIRLLSK